MRDEIYKRVCAVLAKSQKKPAGEVTIDSTFEELGMDSLDGLNLLFDIESEFDISIPDEEARAIHSVRQMVEGVEKLLTSESRGTAAPRP